MTQVAVEHAMWLQAVRGYCLTLVRSFEKWSVGKSGMVEREIVTDLMADYLVYERLFQLITKH